MPTIVEPHLKNWALVREKQHMPRGLFVSPDFFDLPESVDCDTYNFWIRVPKHSVGKAICSCWLGVCTVESELI